MDVWGAAFLGPPDEPGALATGSAGAKKVGQMARFVVSLRTKNRRHAAQSNSMLVGEPTFFAGQTGASATSSAKECWGRSPRHRTRCGRANAFEPLAQTVTSARGGSLRPVELVYRRVPKGICPPAKRSPKVSPKDAGPPTRRFSVAVVRRT